MDEANEFLGIFTGLFIDILPYMIFPIVLMVAINVVKVFMDYDFQSSVNEFENKSKNKSIRLLQDCIFSGTEFIHVQLSYLIDLYEDNPDIYQPMVYKYSETFRIVNSIVMDGKKKRLLSEESFQEKMKDLLKYPMKDFAKMENLVKKNKALEKKNEIDLLQNQIQNEINMLDEIKKLKGSV